VPEGTDEHIPVGTAYDETYARTTGEPTPNVASQWLQDAPIHMTAQERKDFQEKVWIAQLERNKPTDIPETPEEAPLEVTEPSGWASEPGGTSAFRDRHGNPYETDEPTHGSRLVEQDTSAIATAFPKKIVDESDEN
jgi:hypothetical protein